MIGPGGVPFWNGTLVMGNALQESRDPRIPDGPFSLFREYMCHLAT